MEAPPIGEAQVQQVLEWLNTITFSRPPKNIARDFSDGVLMAEVLRFHYPHLVHLHNYQPTNSSSSKYINWKTLNEKIIKKLGFQIHRHDIESIITSTPGSIQRVLHLVYKKILSNTQNVQNTQNNNTVSLANKLSEMSNLDILTGSRKTQNIHGLELLQQNRNNYAKQLSAQMAQKQRIIKELRQTVQILQTKMKKMEQLSKLKDAKIDSLMKKLDEGIGL